jgi:hypothetical protein
MSDIVERLRVKRLQAEIERLNKLQVATAARAELAQIEIEHLRTQCGGNCRYWEGRWRDEAAEVERLRTLLRELIDIKGPQPALLKHWQEAAAEVERLREQVASLQASSGFEASIAQLEIERLRALAKRMAALEDGNG